MKSEISEVEIIQRAKKDSNAFGFLYEKYYNQIFRFIFKKIQDVDESADVCSQVFLKAMLNIKKYEDRGHPFSSWLYRIAINECNLFFRKQKKVLEVKVAWKDIEQIMEESDIEIQEEKRLELISAMNSLNFESINLLEMRFFEKMKFQEMGAILGITEANAKVKVYRALKKLKLLMQEGGEKKQ